jgi:hypothetical protein
MKSGLTYFRKDVASVGNEASAAAMEGNLLFEGPILVYLDQIINVRSE